MSETKTYTEKDVILREREAFVAGAEYVFDFFHVEPTYNRNGAAWRGSRILANGRYPLPKVTRPRVVMDEWGTYWRVVEGALQWTARTPNFADEWQRTQSYGAMSVTAKRIALWSDLLANPTEEVDDV